MNNCKACAYYHEVKKVKLYPGGAECTLLDGYVCSARIDFDDKVEWFVEVDENTYCCNKYVPKTLVQHFHKCLKQEDDNL